MFRIFLAVIILFFMHCNVYAQEMSQSVRFAQFDISKGLPNSTVTNIIQDNQGFMWFGTRNGLSRYDGYIHKWYVNNENDSTSLSNNIINTIAKDKYGNLWVGTDDGICVYKISSQKFKRYLTGQRIRCDQILLTSTGELLLETSSGIQQYDETKDIIEVYGEDPSIELDITGIAEGARQMLWIGTDRGLIQIDMKTRKTLSNYPTAEFSNMHIQRMMCDADKRLWIHVRNKGLFVYDTYSQKTVDLTHIFPNYEYFHSLATDSHGNIWVGTQHGIFIFDRTLNLKEHILQDFSSTANLNDNSIYAIYEDRSENMWIGTYFGGINLFVKGFENIKVYSYGSSSKHLKGKAVRQILENNETELWVATEDGGLNLLNRKTGDIRQFALHNGSGNSPYNIHSLLKDRNGKLWIGTFSQGVYTYDARTNHTESYNSLKNNFPALSCFDLLEDDNGEIWSATPNGLLLFDKKENKFVSRKWFNEVRFNFVYCLLQESSDYLWVGTRRYGLYKLNKKDKKLEKINFDTNTVEFITHLFLDSKRNTWVSTNNEGVYVFDREGNIIKKYSMNNGLPSNAIKAIAEDRDNTIWISTAYGLCSLNPENEKIEIYTVNDGLPVNQFNYSSVYRTDNGFLYFGTINGMISFVPEHMLKDTKKSFKVQITDFKVTADNPKKEQEKAEQLLAAIEQNREVELSYQESKSFSVEFTGLNYQYNTDTQYSMMLEGFDTDWHVIGEQRQVRFINVPSGLYNLHIKASSNSFNWDEEGIKTIRIRINPPFWRTTLAYIIYTILFLILSYITFVYIRMRVRMKIKHREEQAKLVQQEELNKQKMNFFTYVSHDLKTPLTLIISPLQRMLQNKQLSDNIKPTLDIVLKNAGRMNYLIDELLTFSKIEMKHHPIKVKKGNVFTFIQEIADIFEYIATEKNIDFNCKIKSNPNKEVWFSASIVERILYNLLSNALKYTASGGMVNLLAELRELPDAEHLYLEVEDSGKGIPTEQLSHIFDHYYQVEDTDASEGYGIGLALTKSLVNIHKGTINVESESGEGTKFIVDIVVSKEAFELDQLQTDIFDPSEQETHTERMNETVQLFHSVHNKNNAEAIKPVLLIAEDNKELSDYLKEIFSVDYNVLIAYNGKEALDFTRKKLPELIISDIMMPIMNGMEFVKKIKQDIQTSHIPVILLTAKSEGADITDGYKIGVDGYITKPFKAEDLELLVRNLINTRNKNIKRFSQNEDLSSEVITNNPRDEKFLTDLTQLIMDNINNENLDVNFITSRMSISRSLLHIKLRKLANASIIEFIRIIKMREAKRHLLQGKNVSEASYAVGIFDPNYFTKCFKRQFGYTPSDFLKNKKK